MAGWLPLKFGGWVTISQPTATLSAPIRRRCESDVKINNEKLRLYLRHCRQGSCKLQAYQGVWFLGMGRSVSPVGCGHWSTHSPSSLATCWHFGPQLGASRVLLLRVQPSTPRKIPVESAHTFPLRMEENVLFVPSTNTPAPHSGWQLNHNSRVIQLKSVQDSSSIEHHV
jgi:hypothetical protein